MSTLNPYGFVTLRLTAAEDYGKSESYPKNKPNCLRSDKASGDRRNGVREYFVFKGFHLAEGKVQIVIWEKAKWPG